MIMRDWNGSFILTEEEATKYPSYAQLEIAYVQQELEKRLRTEAALAAIRVKRPWWKRLFRG